MARPLNNALRENFAQEFVRCGVGVEAYLSARGIEQATARQRRNAYARAHEFLQESRVTDRIKELKDEIAERNMVAHDEVIAVCRENITRARENPTSPKWAAVALRAAQMMGSSIGMFTDKIEHGGTVRHEHYDARVPLTESERTNRLRELLAAGRN